MTTVYVGLNTTVRLPLAIMATETDGKAVDSKPTQQSILMMSRITTHLRHATLLSLALGGLLLGHAPAMAQATATPAPS